MSELDIQHTGLQKMEDQDAEKDVFNAESFVGDNDWSPVSLYRASYTVAQLEEHQINS